LPDHWERFQSLNARISPIGGFKTHHYTIFTGGTEEKSGNSTEERTVYGAMFFDGRSGNNGLFRKNNIE